MTQNDWQARLTETVAGEVRRYRKLRRMSGRALAERCTELGAPIAQPVLSNLELGRRESISVAELVVLAQALGVSPTLLVAPVTTSETMEILPGREADTTDVAEWFAGDVRFALSRRGLATDSVDWEEEDPAAYVRLYRLHAQLVDEATPLSEELRATFGAAPGETHGEEDQKNAAEELSYVRQWMRANGLRLPRLPAELAYVDVGEEGA